MNCLKTLPEPARHEYTNVQSLTQDLAVGSRALAVTDYRRPSGFAGVVLAAMLAGLGLFAISPFFVLAIALFLPALLPLLVVLVGILLTAHLPAERTAHGRTNSFLPGRD